MTKAHGFFIPDIEYLSDLEGLIKYLGEKVSVGNICLYCNGKGRQIKSLEAVRKHMIDKGHCKIPYDTENEMMEIVDFYDFRSSYPEEQQRKMLEAAERADRGDVEMKEGDEELDDEEFVGTGARLGDDEFELILPSGARLGHRSLNKYYRQNVKPEEVWKKDTGVGIFLRVVACTMAAWMTNNISFPMSYLLVSRLCLDQPFVDPLHRPHGLRLGPHQDQGSLRAWSGNGGPQ